LQRRLTGGQLRLLIGQGGALSFGLGLRLLGGLQSLSGLRLRLLGG
jgi:hypothetical protein